MTRKFSGPFPVHYGQFYLLPQDCHGIDLEDAFRGQRNGLCGTAVREAAFIITGLHTGTVHLSLNIRDNAPIIENKWEEVVEAPLVVGDGGLKLVSWERNIDQILTIRPGTYCARYSAVNMGVGEEEGNYDAAEIEKYRLEIWPSAPVPDKVVRQTRKRAQYWHDFASSLEAINSYPVVAEREIATKRSRKVPKYVYVPSEKSSSTLTISIQPEAEVGEWIEFSAIKENTAWLKVSIDDIDRSSKYREDDVSEKETDLKGQLCWTVEPSGSVAFEGDKVRFMEAGTYRVRARSYRPLLSDSNEIEVKVRSGEVSHRCKPNK